MSSKPFSAILISLLLLAFVVPPVSPQQSATGFNWFRPGFDDSATYFNPQNALNKENVVYVTQDWMSSLSNEPRIYGNETARTTSSLLMVNGLIYMIDRSQIFLAFNSQDARVIWSQQLSVFDPERFGLHTDFVHRRQLNYFDRAVWLIDLDCSIKGYGASNGELRANIPPQILCGDLPSDAVLRDTVQRTISAPVFYEEDRVMIVAPSGFETVGSQLGYVLGINIDTQQVIWKTSLTESPQENLVLGMGPWPIDQENGIVYMGTGSPIPEWNAEGRPGANLYSDSIIALDASTGEIIWHYQTTPHDLNGYGCTGNIALGEHDGRKTVYAACRNGYLYALDAETGDLVWHFDPPAVRRVNSENADFVSTGSYDPDKPWLNHPSTDPAIQCPGVYGAVSSNIVLAYETIYVSTFNRCSRVEVIPVTNIGDTGVANVADLATPVGPINSTIYAVDASTGKAKWSLFFDGIALQGGLTVSGEVLYLPSPDGNLYALNTATGSKVWTRSFGTLGLGLPPVVGATARGNWTLIQVVAGTSSLDFEVEQYSGFLFMFLLPQQYVTVTSEVPPSATVPDFAVYVVVGAAIVLLVAAIIFSLRRRR